MDSVTAQVELEKWCVVTSRRINYHLALWLYQSLQVWTYAGCHWLHTLPETLVSWHAVLIPSSSGGLLLLIPEVSQQSSAKSGSSVNLFKCYVLLIKQLTGESEWKEVSGESLAVSQPRVCIIWKTLPTKMGHSENMKAKLNLCLFPKQDGLDWQVSRDNRSATRIKSHSILLDSNEEYKTWETVFFKSREKWEMQNNNKNMVCDPAASHSVL